MDVSEYGEDYQYSGNCGAADLVASLKWVKENIANFGGDPDNVTIFGQSGGGGKVISMLATLEAEGIIQSGNCTKWK
ncbi:MAG: carboxylesterase family protein [Ruminococcus sp.]